MTQVNFYNLQQEDQRSRLLFACRLTEKARKLGHRVFIQAESPEQARELDELLWRFRPESFLPHTVMETETPDAEAVAIGMARHLEFHGDVLINLDHEPCQSHQRFNRINEILCADADILKAARNRYRYYQDQGYQPETHQI